MESFYHSSSQMRFRFSPMLKFLSDHRYIKLSYGAKQLYTYLYDRQSLSYRNRWFDEKGNVFIRFKTKPAQNDLRKREEKELKDLSLSELMGVDPKTIMKFKKELKEAALLHEVREGMGRTNRIYLKYPADIDEKYLYHCADEEFQDHPFS